MSVVSACEPPGDALHLRYRGNAYLDAFCTHLPRVVTLSQYLLAFYTTPLFRAERLLLAAARFPSREAQARELAAGTADRFAAWTVEARTPTQLLMCDVQANTRSWLACTPDGAGTRLYFGSAVTAVEPDSAHEGWRLRQPYRGMIGAHRLYSRALLAAARRRLLHAAGAAV